LIRHTIARWRWFFFDRDGRRTSVLTKIPSSANRLVIRPQERKFGGSPTCHDSHALIWSPITVSPNCTRRLAAVAILMHFACQIRETETSIPEVVA
jgi:hypothetical protein